MVSQFRKIYCELNEDVDIDSDDDLGQDFQQVYLCVSVDPRRVGGPGGEPTTHRKFRQIEIGF